MKFMMFVKHLQSLPIEQAAAGMRELGFAGMDLTVRPSGIVEPADPCAQNFRDRRALSPSHGLRVPLITTDVLRADEDAIAIFETAADRSALAKSNSAITSTPPSARFARHSTRCVAILTQSKTWQNA